MTEDNTPVDGILSEKEQRILIEPLYSSWEGPPPGEDGEPRSFAALANVGLFSSPDEPPVVPDVMLSLDVTLPEDLGPKKNRSYFMWRFGKPPEVVIEIVSNREGDELGERLRRYRRIRVSYYVVYDPTRELGGRRSAPLSSAATWTCLSSDPGSRAWGSALSNGRGRSKA